jgi:hypothetical protein
MIPSSSSSSNLLIPLQQQQQQQQQQGHSNNNINENHNGPGISNSSVLSSSFLLPLTGFPHGLVMIHSSRNQSTNNNNNNTNTTYSHHSSANLMPMHQMNMNLMPTFHNPFAGGGAPSLMPFPQHQQQHHHHQQPILFTSIPMYQQQHQIPLNVYNNYNTNMGGNPVRQYYNAISNHPSQTEATSSSSSTGGIIVTSSAPDNDDVVSESGEPTSAKRNQQPDDEDYNDEVGSYNNASSSSTTATATAAAINKRRLPAKSTAATAVAINKRRPPARSKYLGISWDKRVKRWRTKANGIHIGYYDDEQVAAEAYDEAKLSFTQPGKPSPRLNFPHNHGPQQQLQQANIVTGMSPAAIRTKLHAQKRIKQAQMENDGVILQEQHQQQQQQQQIPHVDEQLLLQQQQQQFPIPTTTASTTSTKITDVQIIDELPNYNTSKKHLSNSADISSSANAIPDNQQHNGA